MRPFVCGLAAAAALATAACGDLPAKTRPVSSSPAAGVGGDAATSASSIATGGGGGAGGDEDPCAERAARYAALLDASRADAGAPGAVLAIATEDCGVWAGASGTSTKDEAMKPEHVLRIGSVTKTFVATAVLELVEEHLLSLDDTLADHLAGFPGGEGITVRELLNHTSGIFNYTDDAVFQQTLLSDSSKTWTPEALVDVAAAHPPYFAPGAGWHYSNTNYVLLGLIVEQVTQTPVATVLRERLIEPIGLVSTSFDGQERLAGELAHGYSSKGADVSTKFDPSFAWAAGAMVASAGDLARWSQKLYGGSVLEPDTLEAMLTPVDTDVPGIHYGLGAFVFDPAVALDIAYGHLGDIFGYHTQMLYLPHQKIAFAAIVNSDAASPNPISVAVLEEVVR